MAKSPGQQGGPDRGGRRPPVKSGPTQSEGPDKLPRGEMPPDANPKGGE